MVGERVKALREGRAWTQEHLADAAGVSARTVQRLEAGSGYASETAMAVASALNVDVRDLICKGDRPNPLWPDVPLAVKLVVPVLLVLPVIAYGIALALGALGVAVPPLGMFESPFLLIGGPLVALLLPIVTGFRWEELKEQRTAVAVGALVLLVLLFVFFAGKSIGQLARAAGL